MAKEPVVTENALKILQKREYLWRLDNGEQETVSDMFRRVADKVASAEIKFGKPYLHKAYSDAFFEMMCDLRFLPNTPTLVNAGRDKGQLAACFVIPLDDSMEGIMDCLKTQALVQKSGGGCGFNFGVIRERDAIIHSTGKAAVGPIPVIKLMNYMMSEFIIQGGMRRGANMAVLPIDHPSIEEFIEFKEVDNSCPSFNISPAITDAFMEAVENDSDWDLLSVVDGSIKKTIKARELFDKIATMAWRTGDPGLLFIDTINEFNTTPHLGRLEASNPCSELPLLPNEACTLGSLNLPKYYIKEPVYNGTWQSHFNFEQFHKDIELGIRFLDNVIEINHYVIPAIEQMHKETNRKVGLGHMGFADLLILLNIPYNSQEAREVAHTLGCKFDNLSKAASENLGYERGSFGAFEKSTLSRDWEHMRNAGCNTIAPTGTISIIANCSTGIEPVFAYILKREQAGMTMYEYHPLFKAYLDKLETWQQNAITSYYFESGTLQGCPQMPEHVQKIFVQANDISPADHIRMQATWQQYIDSSISKTINMPNSSTVDDVKNAYMTAWKMGVKGITIYRSGCRANEPLQAAKKQVSSVTATPVPRMPDQHALDTSTYPPGSVYDVVTTVIPTPQIYYPIHAPAIGEQYSSTFSTGHIYNQPTPSYVTFYSPESDEKCPECGNKVDNGGGCLTCKACGWALCHSV
jgi:ribonucleoside-diphosphate reductase alpha chain